MSIFNLSLLSEVRLAGIIVAYDNIITLTPPLSLNSNLNNSQLDSHHANQYL